jgi:hypothetical protein
MPGSTTRFRIKTLSQPPTLIGPCLRVRTNIAALTMKISATLSLNKLKATSDLMNSRFGVVVVLRQID